MHEEHTKKAATKHHHRGPLKDKSLADTTPRRISTYFPDSDANNGEGNYSTPPATGKLEPVQGAGDQTPSPVIHRPGSSTDYNSKRSAWSQSSSIFSSLPSRAVSQTPSYSGYNPDVSFNGETESPDTAQPPPGQQRMFFSSSPGRDALPPRPTRRNR